VPFTIGIREEKNLGLSNRAFKREIMVALNLIGRGSIGEQVAGKTFQGRGVSKARRTKRGSKKGLVTEQLGKKRESSYPNHFQERKKLCE